MEDLLDPAAQSGGPRVRRAGLRALVYSSLGFYGRQPARRLPGRWFVRALGDLGVSESAARQTLYRMEEEGLLTSHRLGRDKLYPRSRALCAPGSRRRSPLGDAGRRGATALRDGVPRLVVGNFSSVRAGYPMPETADEGRQVVRSFVDAGYDWIKVYSFLPAEGFRGLMEEAHRLGIPVGGHVPVEVGVTNALESGLRSIEHLTQYVAHTMTPESRRADETDFRSVFHAGEIEDGALDRLIAQTVEAGVWNVPTIVWFDRNLPFSGAATAWSDRSLRKEGVRNRREIVRRLYEAGALLAVGTDSDDGFELSPSAYHDELEVLHEAGIPRGEVLRMATLGGARLLGLEGETGSIEPGKRADLLILYCDPREDLACLRTPEAGLARGRGSR